MDLEVLGLQPDSGVSGTTLLPLGESRAPLTCRTLEADGVVWVAATRAMMRASYQAPRLDLLVCVHDVPHDASRVGCPRLVVHEYGDHEARWGRVWDARRTLLYRTGFVVEPEHSGEIAGGVYVSRDLVDGPGAVRSRLLGVSRKDVVAQMADWSDSGASDSATLWSEIGGIIEATPHVGVYYVGERQGSEEFLLGWVRARAHRSAVPVLFVIRQSWGKVCDLVADSGVSWLAFGVSRTGIVARRGADGRVPRVCLVVLEDGVPHGLFERILAIANDVSLLTGDHSITEALAAGWARSRVDSPILPLPYVGWYEKAEDYGRFLFDLDPRLASAYLNWVLPRVDGTDTRTLRGTERVRRMLAGIDDLGLEFLFSEPAIDALRRGVAGFFPWLLESRAGLVAGRDAGFIPQSFPRAVAHLLGGHNIDDLRIS